MDDATTPMPAEGNAPAPPTPRLTISQEDLRSPGVEARIKELQEAAAPQLIRQVGAPSTPQGNAFFRGAVVTLGLAGLVGGLLGWFVAEILMRPDSPDAPLVDDPMMQTAIWVTIFAVGLAAVLGAWEGIELRSTEKAWISLRRTLPVAAGLALVGGLIAQAIYSQFVESAVEEALRTSFDFDDFIRRVEAALRIPRAIAFLTAGAAVGAGLGLGSRTRQRAINGLIGGAAGGFVGGLTFSVFATGAAARATALTITGVAVAVGIALVEQARKDLWLEIVTGGMAGKQFIIYHERTMIGSSPHCGVTLIKDPEIAPEHAELVRTPRGTLIRAMGQRPVVVNGRPTAEAQLSDGDQVQIGSTVVRFATKEQVMPTLTEAF